MFQGCPSNTSLGITRSFPRLYPISGLVTFALLTLAPLTLRCVRLACLIHAANVHSEPGSNPSKVAVNPLYGRLARSSSQRVEEFLTGRTEDVSQRLFLAAGFERPTLVKRPKTMRTLNASLPVAGSPQGFTT